MAVGAAGGLFEATVHSASHLAETMNKVNVVLGDGAGRVIANAEYMAEQYGFVKKEVIDASSSFALLGKEMKMSDDAASAFGTKLTKLAADATSLSDIPLDRMLEKMRMALAGQVRPLRELGIFMTASAVKDEAARMGLKPRADTGQLSEGDKIKARVSFIENSTFMKKAAGDLERTLDSTENQTRKFWGTLSNLATSVGEELNPAWNKLLQDFNSGLDSLKTYFENNKSMVRSWGDSVVETFNTAKLIWRNLPDILEIALLGADQKMEDARAKIEAWATQAAVAVENAFLKAAQSVANFFKKAQDLVTAGASYGAAGLEKVTTVYQSAAESVSKTWDSAIGAIASRADIAFRPIRDLTNSIERKAGAGDYKQMSVEEDVGRLKGGLSGVPKFFAGLSDYFKTYQDVAGESIKAKPKDFTSSLIDKANKHLADTLGQNTDISSKGIAAAQERITKREADRLNEADRKKKELKEADRKKKELEEVATDKQDFLESMGLHPKGFPRLAERDKLDAAAREKLDKENEKQDFLQSLGLKGLARLKSDRPGGEDGKGGAGEDEEAAAIGGGGKSKHHKAIEDSASFAQNLAAQQLGGDVQEKQLTELQQIRAIDQKNADMMERMYNRAAKAAYA